MYFYSIMLYPSNPKKTSRHLDIPTASQHPSERPLAERPAASWTNIQAASRIRYVYT